MFQDLERVQIRIRSPGDSFLHRTRWISIWLLDCRLGKRKKKDPWMWSFEEIRRVIIFPGCKKYPRDLPVPSLINIACGGCTLLNLALHLSKFARADRHCHVRRMTVMGPCALWGIAAHQARRRWACQGSGLTAWTVVLFFPNSELQFPSPTGGSLALLVSSTAGDLHCGWRPQVLISSHFSTCSGDAISTSGAHCRPNVSAFDSQEEWILKTHKANQTGRHWCVVSPVLLS